MCPQPIFKALLALAPCCWSSLAAASPRLQSSYHCTPLAYLVTLLRPDIHMIDRASVGLSQATQTLVLKLQHSGEPHVDAVRLVLSVQDCMCKHQSCLLALNQQVDTLKQPHAVIQL